MAQSSVSQDRERYIGGSDIGAILNISPFTTRFNLLKQKAGLYTGDKFEGNEYTEYGNQLEPKIRDYINEDLDDKFYEGKMIIEPRANEPIGIRLHTDGQNRDTILEIKTTSRVHEEIDEYKLYLSQLLFYMVVANKCNGILAVYHRPEDFNEEFQADRLRLYRIHKDDYTDFIKRIFDEVEKFKEDLTRLKKNPHLTEEDLLPCVVPETVNKILLLEKKLQEYKETENKLKEFKEDLKRQMVENNIKKFKLPNGTSVCLVEDGEEKVKKVFDEETFKENEPLLYELYRKEKITKGKTGFVKITLPKKKGN